MKNISCLFFLILLSLSTFAQKTSVVKGRVVDSDNRAIAYVSVMLIAEEKVVIGALTDTGENSRKATTTGARLGWEGDAEVAKIHV